MWLTSGTSSSAPPASITISTPDGDKACEQPDPQYNKTFSKSITKKHIDEYKSGKFTRKYIEVYVEFTHMNGFIDNLTYLEFKEFLSKE